MKKLCGIYKIENLVNKKVYIGSSKDILSRIRLHRSQLNNNIHGSTHLQHSFNKYGIKNFIFVILEICENDILLIREKFYIDKYNALDRNYGYNKASNLENTSGYKWSDESRLKLSMSKKGKKIHPNTKIALIEANKKREYKMDYLWTDENIKKSAEARTKKNILQYSLDGNFIKEWKSPIYVKKELGIAYSQIYLCCSGDRYQAGGFQWFTKPKNNIYPLKISKYQRCSKNKNISEFMRLCSEMSIEKSDELLENPEEDNQQPS